MPQNIKFTPVFVVKKDPDGLFYLFSIISNFSTVTGQAQVSNFYMKNRNIVLSKFK